MRGRSLVTATGIALLALTSGGLTAASAAPSTPVAAGAAGAEGQPASLALIQGLVVIATGSVAPCTRPVPSAPRSRSRLARV